MNGVNTMQIRILDKSHVYTFYGNGKMFWQDVPRPDHTYFMYIGKVASYGKY